MVQDFPGKAGGSAGDVEKGWTPQVPPPAGVRLQNLRKEGKDEVRLFVSMPHDEKLSDLIIALGAVLMAAAGQWLVPPQFAFFFYAAALTLAFYPWQRTHPTQWMIAIEPGTVIVSSRRWPRPARNLVRIPFMEIESIGIEHTRLPTVPFLSIRTTSKQHEIATGVPQEALVWLKNYLIMELAGLTWRPIRGPLKSKAAAGADETTNPVLLKPELAVRLVNIFLDQAAKELADLEDAVSAREAPAIRRHAHWLKSASANVGARHMSELCQLVELYAIDSDLDHVPLLLQEIRDKMPGVRTWLQEIRASAAEKIVDDARPEAQSVHPLPVPAMAVAPVDPAAMDAAPVRALPADVLVVDDSAVSRELAREFLSDIVTGIEFAKSGREAIEKWEQKHFDLILMDCEMIDVNGFEATIEIRKREARTGRGRTPIVALTGNVLKNHKERCLEIGMDDYVAKPYPPDALQKVVDRWVAKREAESEAPSVAPGRRGLADAIALAS